MTIEINFHKMHGLGNDFMLIDLRNQSLSAEEIVSLNLQNLAEKLADRNRGVGFDQMILLDVSNEHDASYRFFNPDGSEAEQCGNGQRCITHYLNLNSEKTKTQYSVKGKAGVIHSEFHDENRIKVFMGSVKDLGKKTIADLVVYSVSVGNPHAVVVVDAVEQVCFDVLKNKICKDDINLEAVEVLSPSHLRIRVHERGTGETQACGSGACAVVAALASDYNLDSEVTVSLPGGDLMIKYDSKSNDVWLSGPSRHVFTGTVKI